MTQDEQVTGDASEESRDQEFNKTLARILRVGESELFKICVISKEVSALNNEEGAEHYYQACSRNCKVMVVEQVERFVLNVFGVYVEAQTNNHDGRHHQRNEAAVQRFVADLFNHLCKYWIGSGEQVGKEKEHNQGDQNGLDDAHAHVGLGALECE